MKRRTREQLLRVAGSILVLMPIVLIASAAGWGDFATAGLGVSVMLGVALIAAVEADSQ